MSEPATQFRIPRSSVKANFSWTFVGSLTYAACQWLMLAAIARIGDQFMLGQFALAAAITAPIMLFAKTNLQGLQSTDVRRQYSFRDYMGFRLVAIVTALLVFACVSIWHTKDHTTAVVILLFGSSKCIGAISEVFHGLFQQVEQMKYQAWSNMLRGTLQLALMAGGLFVTGDLVCGMYGLLIAELLVLLLVDLPFGSKLCSQHATPRHVALRSRLHTTLPRWQRATLFQLAVLAVPLGLTGFSNSLRTYLPRYFVADTLGIDALGGFAVVAYTLTILELLGAPIRRATLPTFARLALTEPRAFTRHLAKLGMFAAAFGAVMTLLASVAGKPLLSLVYGSTYAAYASLFVGMLAMNTIGSVASMLGMGVMAVRRFRAQMIVNVSATIAVALASWILIPKFGLWGAVYGIGAGAAIRISGFLFVLWWFISPASIRSQATYREGHEFEASEVAKPTGQQALATRNLNFSGKAVATLIRRKVSQSTHKSTIN